MSEELEAFISSLQNIIDQQKSEIFKLKSIINSIPGSIYWKDLNGKYLGRNLYAAEKMCDIGENGDLNINSIIGKTDYDLFEQEIAEQYEKHDRAVINSGKELITEEVVTTSNNDIITQLSTKRPLYDEYGNIIGIIGNTVNISHLKKIENDLQIAKKKLESANKIKDDFIHNMEHDIRTPFSGILGLANYLAEQEQDSTKKGFLNDIALSAKQLLNYCNTILDYSKIEMESVPIVEKKLNLNEVMEALILVERPAAINKKLSLTYQHDNDIPKVILGDQYRLQRIFVNLISNAIKFTNAGKISIQSKLVKVKEKDIVVSIIVQDDGIGMAEDKINFIYEKFYRDVPSNRGLYKGLGLGLKVVKHFVNDLGGEIEVKSKVNAGTTFCCTFPFKLPLREEILNDQQG
jgi:signal transduction histidine kinase